MVACHDRPGSQRVPGVFIDPVDLLMQVAILSSRVGSLTPRNVIPRRAQGTARGHEYPEPSLGPQLPKQSCHEENLCQTETAGLSSLLYNLGNIEVMILRMFQTRVSCFQPGETCTAAELRRLANAMCPELLLHHTALLWA